MKINHNFSILIAFRNIIKPKSINFNSQYTQFKPIFICLIILGISALYLFLPHLLFAASDWASEVKTKVDEGRTGLLTIVGGVVAIVIILAGVAMMVKGQIEAMKLWVFLIGGAMMAGAGAFADYVTK